MPTVFWDFVRKLEARVRQDDQTSFYKHLMKMSLKWKRDRSSVYIKDENGILLRDVDLLRERQVPSFHTHLNAKLLKLDSNII